VKFIEITREKIKIVDNDLRAAINEMDVKLTDLLKYPEFAHHFGVHSYFNNLNIQEHINSLFQLNPNTASTFHYDRQSTNANTLPFYVGIQLTYVETER